MKPEVIVRSIFHFKNGRMSLNQNAAGERHVFGHRQAVYAGDDIDRCQ